MPFQPPLTVDEVQEALPNLTSGATVLSSGGQGSVFRALHPGPPPVSIALKIYSPRHLEQRARREVQALERLSVPSIARVIAHGTIGIRGEQCFYLATEFVEGTPLADVVAAGPSDGASVCTVGSSIADALEAIWDQRIVHRDVKPDNIISQIDKAVLIDLGIARHMSLESLTTSGATWGTEGYMSPEQGRARRQLSCKSDVFSLGIVLQEMVAGRHPTNGDQRALQAGGAPTATLGADCPQALSQVIDQMIARRPEKRPGPVEVSAKLKDLRRGFTRDS